MGKLIHLSDYRKSDPEKENFLKHDLALKVLDDALMKSDNFTEKCLTALIYSSLGAECASLASAIIADNNNFYDYALSFGIINLVFSGIYHIHNTTRYKGEFREQIRNKDILED